MPRTRQEEIMIQELVDALLVELAMTDPRYLTFGAKVVRTSLVFRLDMNDTEGREVYYDLGACASKAIRSVRYTLTLGFRELGG